MKNIFSKHKNINRGFSLIEIIVASAIISILTFSVTAASQKGLLLSELALHETQSGYLLEEGAEAVKSIRDGSWATISNLTIGTTYYLSYSNSTNTWSLSTTSNNIDNFFTRTVVFTAVNRDANDDIAASGTADARTKKVSVTVSWLYSGTTVTKTLSFYIADIFT